MAKNETILFKQEEPNFNDLFAGLAGSVLLPTLIFIVLVSCVLKEPLGLLLVGNSSSGKSYLLKYVMKLMPEEWIHIMSKASDAVLSKYSEDYFMNKAVIYEELEGLSDGAMYTLRLLMSEGVYRYDVTGLSREASSETLKGPISLVGTTSEDLKKIKEDDLNRVILVEVDHSVEQTKRILELQALEAEGVDLNFKEEFLRINCKSFLRSLENVAVVIPFASKIIPRTNSIQVRRDFPKILSLIKVVVFLRQHLKEKKYCEDSGSYFYEAEVSDYEVVYQLLSVAFKRTLDESRGLAEWISQIKCGITLSKSREFTRKNVQEWLGIGQTKAGEILRELYESSAIKIVKPSRSNQLAKYAIDVNWSIEGKEIFVTPKELANACSRSVGDS